MLDETADRLNLHPVFAGALVVVSLAGLGFATAVGWNLLFPAPVFQAQMDASCSLHAGPCRARFSDGSTISLTITPQTPAANQPLRLTVETSGQQPDEVSVALQGRTMNMGLIRTPLLDTGHGAFTGDTTLPMCVRDRMNWTATVVSAGTRGRYRAGFNFVMLNR